MILVSRRTFLTDQVQAESMDLHNVLHTQLASDPGWHNVSESRTIFMNYSVVTNHASWDLRPASISAVVSL